MRGRYVWCVAQYENDQSHPFSVPETELRRGDAVLKNLACENQRNGILPPGQIKHAQRGK